MRLIRCIGEGDNASLAHLSTRDENVDDASYRSKMSDEPLNGSWLLRMRRTDAAVALCSKQSKQSNFGLGGVAAHAKESAVRTTADVAIRFGNARLTYL